MTAISDSLRPEPLEKLERFVALLDKWRNNTNLISENGFRNVWERHVEDSIVLQSSSPKSRRWLDIGSGAGFPGIVLGILVDDWVPAQIHCVESDGRKCAFLRTVVRELEIPVRVHHIRAENLGVAEIGQVDVVTARAFSSIEKILQLSEPFLDQGAVALLPRGESSIAEVEAVDLNRYTIRVDANPSTAGGVIVRIHKRWSRAK